MLNKSMFHGIAVAICLLVVSVSWLHAQGDYAPVTEADVVKLKLNHYYTPDKRPHEPDFAWTFTKNEFVLKKGKGEIPTDLLTKLLPAGSTAGDIRGKWKVEGGRLILTEIRTAAVPAEKEVNLPIYRTAPAVVRIGDVQYVFWVE